MRKWCIYLLSKNKEPFYVGRSFVPAKRFEQHKKRFGVEIKMRILQSGRGKHKAKEAEIKWLDHFMAKGRKFANKMHGSNGVWTTSDSTKKKIGLASKRRWKQPGERERHSKIISAQMADPKHRERIRKTVTKKRRTAEARKLQAQLMKERWADPKFRKKTIKVCSKRLTEQRKDPKFNRKMNKKRWGSIEARQKQSQFAKTFWSQKHRQYMSKVMKEKWRDVKYRGKVTLAINIASQTTTSRKKRKQAAKSIWANFTPKERMAHIAKCTKGHHAKTHL